MVSDASFSSFPHCGLEDSHDETLSGFFCMCGGGGGGSTGCWKNHLRLLQRLVCQLLSSSHLRYGLLDIIIQSHEPREGKTHRIDREKLIMTTAVVMTTATVIVIGLASWVSCR